VNSNNASLSSHLNDFILYHDLLLDLIDCNTFHAALD
jgi:hypothetical protein